MYCPQCGASTQPGATFCAACGATLATAPQAPATGATAAPPSPRAPLTVGEPIRAAFRQAFDHFGAFLATQGVFILLAAAFGLALALAIDQPDLDALFAPGATPDPAEVLAEVGPVLGASAASVVVVAILGLLGSGVGVVVADSLHRGERLTLGSAWSHAAPRIGNLLLTALVAGLAVVGVFMAGALLVVLVVPVFLGIAAAIYLVVRWALFAPVSILERRSVTENLRRAAAITKGSRGAIFAAILLLIAVGGVPRVAMILLLAPDAPPGPLAIVVSSVVGTAFQLVAAFVGSAYVVHAYRQLSPGTPEGAR